MLTMMQWLQDVNMWRGKVITKT